MAKVRSSHSRSLNTSSFVYLNHLFIADAKVCWDNRDKLLFGLDKNNFDFTCSCVFYRDTKVAKPYLFVLYSLFGLFDVVVVVVERL